jgi:hypothetical protein
MDSTHEKRLIVFSIVATVVAVAFGLVAYAANAPVWLSVIVVGVAIAALTAVARRVQVGRWNFGRQHWTLEHDGRAVEVIFDERLVFINRLTLIVDGREVDRGTIWYGTKELTGDSITVAVGSGWIGECTGVVVCDDSGAQLPFEPH